MPSLPGWLWALWPSAGEPDSPPVSPPAWHRTVCRCLSLCCPEVARVLYRRRRNLATVLAIWLYSVLLVLPTLSQWYGQFGYDAKLGKCDYLPPLDEDLVHPRQLFLSVAFIVPLLLIGLSYLTIWRTTLRDGSIVASE